MNRKYSLIVSGVVLVVALMLSAGVIAQEQGLQSPQSAIGAAFTYQGQLKNASGPITGSCDFQFRLWDSRQFHWAGRYNAVQIERLAIYFA